MPNDEPLVDSELADTAPQRRKGPWKLIVIVILLTAIGVWLVPGESPDQAPDTAQSEKADIAPTPDGDTAKSEALAPSLLETPRPASDDAATAVEQDATADEPVIDDRPGAKARALIAEMRASGQIDPQAVFDAAEAAQTSRDLADAYLLYFFAAREGHTSAALALGRQADPQSHDPDNSVFETPDLNQAHKWYQLAAQNGNDEGRQQLAALRIRVERQAAAGDPEAQRISLLWQ